MNLMAWSAHFVSGIDAVDAQHKALVEMINAAAPHLASGGDDAQSAAGPLLDKLVAYAASHFQFEENLMQQAGVLPSYFAQHQKTHQTFVDEVIQMRTQYEKGQSLSGNDLLHFLTSWLTFHILSEDKHMAVQVLAIRRGDTPAQAFAALDTSKGAPQAVYNAALVDLFSLLTARNRTLALANAQVRDAQRALEAANSQLETRVQERTRELADANRALEAERQALVESIARLQQTQARLLQSEKMAAVGQLAAGVAHEINNPIGFVSSNLGTLSTYVEQLLTLLAAYEKTRTLMPAALRASIEGLPAHAELGYIREDAPELLRESKEGLARVKRIVSDLRDFSRADTSEWKRADLQVVLDSALQVVRNMVLAGGLMGTYVNIPGMDLHQFWTYSLYTACTARWLAERGPANPDLAFTLGLMHGIGQLHMHSVAPASAVTLDQQAHVLSAERAHCERQALGFSYLDVSAALAGAWNFPHSLQEPLPHIADPLSAPAFPAVAATVHLGAWHARNTVLEMPAEELSLHYPHAVGARLGMAPHWALPQAPGAGPDGLPGIPALHVLSHGLDAMLQ